MMSVIVEVNGKRIASMEITNVSNLDPISNYDVRAAQRTLSGACLEHVGRVEGHARTSPPLDLVRKAIASLGDK